MFVCRVVFFQLYESPRYLVHAGRPEEAVYVLQQINKVNGNKLDVRLQDVHDKIAGDITPRVRAFIHVSRAGTKGALVVHRFEYLANR